MYCSKRARRLLERSIASVDLLSARVSHFAHFVTLAQMSYCVIVSVWLFSDIRADCVLR